MEQNTQFIFASVVFIIAYVLIMSEKIHRAVIALVGAAIMLLSGVLTQEQAVHAVDFNTIGLLIGMMIIVGITMKTGVFEYMAIWAAKRAKGEPIHIMVALAAITAVASALLDNVTTVLLIVPVTFSIVNELKINPMPFLITEVLASNIGGTATLIGDPPNIMIGSATHLGFMDFLINLAPVAILVYIATIIVLKFLYRKQLQVSDELKQNIMKFDEKAELKDVPLLKKCGFVLALVTGGFMLHGVLHLDTATIALSGAALLLLITRIEPENVMHSIEFPTIFFFAGLFVLVGALEHTGVINAIAIAGLKVTGGEMLSTGMLILWLSAIASAFVDNIPFTATMIPLIKDMGAMGGISNLDPLYWSLAMGACFGGNGTMIGAAANVIVAGMAERQGHPISFIGFMKVAFPLMLMSIFISMGYLMLRYF